MMETVVVLELVIYLVLLGTVLSLAIIACIFCPKRKEEIIVSAFLPVIMICWGIVSLFV